jgi:prepilin-type N-terminal cleavage/methylation domain-containing protein
MKPYMRRLRDQGFTLLELMIVVLVLALVLAVSYPSLSRGSTALHLRATGRDVLNTFRYAREKAVTEQTGMRIVVDQEKQTLTLTNDLGEEGRTYAMPKDVKIQGMALAGNEITTGPLIVRFLPNGSADSAEIVLKSQTGALLHIISDPITGGARIQSEAEGNNR